MKLKSTLICEAAIPASAVAISHAVNTRRGFFSTISKAPNTKRSIQRGCAALGRVPSLRPLLRAAKLVISSRAMKKVSITPAAE